MRILVFILSLATIPWLLDLNFQDDFIHLPAWLYYYIILHACLIILMNRYIKSDKQG